jgi:hypothetical protein
LRIRGHAHERSLTLGKPLRVEAFVNGQRVGQMHVDRPGLFVLEADLPDAPQYRVEIQASPAWSAPPDDRVFTVNIGMIRLVPRD